MVSVGRERIIEGLARRAARWMPTYWAPHLRNPVFVVGFNNSGKSTVVKRLARSPELCVFPGEGNGELWFPGFFPWLRSEVQIKPIWSDPDRFVDAVLAARHGRFLSARAQLGAYEALNAGRMLVNDSGMLAALAPELLEDFILGLDDAAHGPGRRGRARSCAGTKI